MRGRMTLPVGVWGFLLGLAAFGVSPVRKQDVNR